MNARSSRRPAANPRPGPRQGRPGQPGRPGTRRPLPQGPLYTPGAGGTRQAVEGRSARVVLLLHQLPKWLLPLVMVALLVAGLAVRGPGGGAALAAMAAVLGWLAYLSWPALASQGRLLRVLGITGVLVLAAVQSLR
ncbi:MAG: DUF6703 family protein [Gemmatimonadota bacterium]